MKTILVMVAGVVVTGCASGPKPMQDHQPKSELGFRFEPPQTSGWSEIKPEGRKGFIYDKTIKGVDPKRHAISFNVQYGSIDTGLTRPEEILNFVRMRKENHFQSMRFQIQKDVSRFVTFRGAKCLEFDSLAKDKTLNQNLSLAGLFCIHPDDMKRFVEISYSQRHELSRPELDIFDEGERFVRSVSFLPILKKGHASRAGEK